MTEYRQNDNYQPSQRIERTFNINELWYFEVRGGGQQGPYDSQNEMQQALKEFIQLQQEFNTH